MVRLKKLLNKTLYNGWLIWIFSLVWFLVRTGIKPTRVIYPCQQVARANLAVFGLPAITTLYLRIKKCRQFRKKVIFNFAYFVVFLTIVFSLWGYPQLKLWWQASAQLNNDGPIGTGNPRVVWVHDPQATNWDYTTGWYGDYLDQAIVNQMTENGLKTLAGSNNWQEVKNFLIPDYTSGEKIAIKVNFNNVSNCQDSDNQIDALPQPVIALIKSLDEMGVQQQDIIIYDATQIGRYIPDRFRNPFFPSFSDVSFYGRGSCAGVNQSTFNQIDPSLEIQFSDPDSNLSNRWLPDLLYQATYLINMPILKKHGISPTTLGFKNHIGSLNNIIRGGNDNIHYYISPSHSLYTFNDPGEKYNPLVDIYNNPNIRNKTILTIGEGLYGAPGATLTPRKWNTFNNDAPNSLFFSKDPVAIESVMTDFLRPEFSLSHNAYHHLIIAASSPFNLGVYEKGDPLGSGYTQIDFVKCDPDCPNITPEPTSLPTPTPTLIPSPTATPTFSPQSKADVNKDKIVNLADIQGILFYWGQSCTVQEPACVADVNDDKLINIADIAGVIFYWGQTIQ